ncbi:MAG: UDP-N-acetylmuramoyl-L-alanyl-D-glutamate--2,6-diaminopimelate ligase [Candidatus Kapaibacterium sp.]|nr:MAG: UDP-N-acetylmuramoyl-L-alanyl-D-glutamate--2,6-diaminopimelate ligase [Candidatus Kapabacteria bacterium]
MKSLHTLLTALPHFTMTGDEHALARAVTGIYYDSRQCAEDALFVAMRGMAVDGYDFIPQAIERGARCIVAEREYDAPSGVTVVIVSDARKALASLSHAWFDEPSEKLHVFGVTGTNGKTTTTFMLKSLLEARGEKVGIIGTTGNYIGAEVIPSSFTTPEAPELCALFVEMRKRGATAIVMEVSSHALTLERVHRTHFRGAIFTNLTQDHLDFHETMEKYAAAKQRLFTMLPADALIAVNGSDTWSAFMTKESVVPEQQRRAFWRTLAQSGQGNSQKNSEEKSQKNSNDVEIIAIRLGFTETAFTLSAEGKSYDFTMSPIGGFNVDNAAGCLVMMRLLGATWEELQGYMQRVEGAPGRMQRIPLVKSTKQEPETQGMTGDAAVAIVDYAHTPDALEKALLSCVELRNSLTTGSNASSEEASRQKGRIFCVFGCGGNRDRTKRPKMGACAAELADFIIPTSDNPREEEPLAILDDILAGIPKEKFATTRVLADRREAIQYAIGAARAGDIVLIAGKGHENYQIIGNERIHFDDAEEVQKCLR